MLYEIFKPLIQSLIISALAIPLSLCVCYYIYKNDIKLSLSQKQKKKLNDVKALLSNFI